MRVNDTMGTKTKVYSVEVVEACDRHIKTFLDKRETMRRDLAKKKAWWSRFNPFRLFRGMSLDEAYAALETNPTTAWLGSNLFCGYWRWDRACDIRDIALLSCDGIVWLDQADAWIFEGV